jgi:hypothetical protein
MCQSAQPIPLYITEGKGCIFKYTYVKRDSEEEVTQTYVGVSIIEKVHSYGDPASPVALVDNIIRFCPPKVAKPQKGTRPDTLYHGQNINPYMCFNLHYKSNTGKKVEEEDKT